MKKALLLIIAVVLLVFPPNAEAQTPPYEITSFASDITINQDASITVTETLEVYFYEPRHGIFRNIPVVYRTKDKTINSKLSVNSVVDEHGARHKYETSRSGDDMQIKIGDADKYVSGRVVYVIRYRARNIIQRESAHDELYWNVVGSGWDAPILSTKASVKSDFAQIENIQCFAGSVGVDTKCESLSHDKNSAEFVAGAVLGNGQDMTIVVGLNQDNKLTFSASAADLFSDYWGYPAAFLPALLMGFVWYKRGRDERHIGDNIYFNNSKDTEKVPVFMKREFLPMVYSPIANLTPAEVGSIVDERVDIHDVVAEIAELGRLGYLKIERIKKRFRKDDYLMKKLNPPSPKATVGAGLRDYQQYLYESIFSYGEGGEVKLSELKRKFHTKLSTFREKLYQHVEDAGYFFDHPDKTRGKWIAIAVVVAVVTFILTFQFFAYTFDFWPFVIFGISSALAFIFAYQMPRKTAQGYALFRQTRGLAFYLKKGKWREEIKEKQLFLDEILPLAISLGVVKKLAKDMQELGVAEPSYFSGGGVAWANSFNNFSSSASSTMVAGSSSGSSWSGGSGFSGGSSGGGFGGGGGGSW